MQRQSNRPRTADNEQQAGICELANLAVPALYSLLALKLSLRKVRASNGHGRPQTPTAQSLRPPYKFILFPFSLFLFFFSFLFPIMKVDSTQTNLTLHAISPPRMLGCISWGDQ